LILQEAQGQHEDLIIKLKFLKTNNCRILGIKIPKGYIKIILRRSSTAHSTSIFLETKKPVLDSI